MNGNIFILKYGVGTPTPIAAGRSDRIITQAATIPVSSATYEEWEHLIAGRKSWNITCEWLVLNNSDSAKLLLVGDTYTVIFGNRAGTGVTGSAILERCQIDAVRGSLATGAFVFRGTGPLTVVPSNPT